MKHRASLLLLLLPALILSQGSTYGAAGVAAWGSNTAGQTNVPAGLSNVVAVAGGNSHSLALKSDGTVLGWGSINVTGFTPTNLTDITGIAAGHSHALALRANGTVVAWGRNNTGQTNVPAGLLGIIAIAAGNGHNIALHSDGTVTAWGFNTYGQADVPPGLSGVTEIAAGHNHNLALKSDGTIVAWGQNASGQCNVPPGLSGVVALSGGAFHSLALKADGSVLAWGNNSSGQTNVPPHATNVIAIAAGYSHTLALFNDASVVAWGSQSSVPAEVTNVVVIAAGHHHNLAVLDGGLPEIVGQPASITEFSGKPVSLTVIGQSSQPITYQWRKNGETIDGATAATLTFQSAQVSDSGTYTVVVSDSRGSVLSAEAILTVTNSEPLIITSPISRIALWGGSATFEVVADGSFPLSYQWRLRDTNVTGATGASLLLTNVDAANAGPYTVVIGNSFGSVTSGVATLTLSTIDLPGGLDLLFNPPLPNAVVRCVAVQEDGAVLIGGWFTVLGGFPRPHLARLNSDGTLDQGFHAGLDGVVLALGVQSDGRIVIAGDFLNVNGVPRPRIARLNSNGTLDAGFNPGLGPDASVWAVEIENDGKILIGGDFNHVDGTPRRSVALLNSDGTLDQSFARVTGLFGGVRSVAVQSDGRILIGGNFSEGSISIGRIIRLDRSGAEDPGFQATFGDNGWVNDIAIQPDGRILAGGSFLGVNGTGRPYIARLNTDGSLDAEFDTKPSDAVNSIALQTDGKIVIGGGFFSVNEVARGRLARLQPNGALDATFESSPGANDWIEAVALQSDGNIIIAGAFWNYGGVPRQHVARVAAVDPTPFAPYFVTPPASYTIPEGAHVALFARARAFPLHTYQWQFEGVDLPGQTNETVILRNVRLTNAGTYKVVVDNELGMATAIATLTILPAPTNPGSTDINFYTGTGPDGTVSALSPQVDGKVVIGGNFINVDGVARPQLARLNADGSLDTGFVPSLFGTVHSLWIVPVLNGRILVGGEPPRNLVRLIADGTLDTSFASALSADIPVHAVIMAGDRIVVSMGNRVHRLMSNGAADATFQVVDVNGIATALAAHPDGRIVIGGQFNAINGVPCGNIAQVRNGILDPLFNAGSGANQRVSAVAVETGGRILIAGDFTRVNGIARTRVARLNANGSVDLSFDPGAGPDHSVKSLALYGDGRLLIAGSFAAFGDIPRGRVARLNHDGSLDLTFDPQDGGADESVNAIALLPGAPGNVLIGGDFYNVNDVPRPRIARLRGGGPATLAPSILVGPYLGDDVAAGQDVTFTVVASGVPAPRYQWQFKGANIPGATNWVLRLYNVRTTNNGDYRVVVTNPFGTVTSGAAILAVEPAPRHAGAADIEFYTGAGPNDRVNAIALQADGRIVIGGAFTEFDGLPRNRLARLERSGALDRTFDPGLGANGIVYAVAAQVDGRLLVAGEFTSFDGMARARVARLNSNGSVDETFDPGDGPNGRVAAIALQTDGNVLIGGEFSMVGAVPRSAIARLISNGALEEGFGSPWINGSIVNAIDFQGAGRVVVGGLLRGANGFSTNCARLTASGELDPTFQTGSGPNGPLFALGVQDDDRLIVAGAFNAYSGASRFNIARLNANGALDFPSYSPRVDGFVRAVELQRDGRALIGGDFRLIGGFPFGRMARLTTTGVPDFSFYPTEVTSDRLVLDEYGELVDIATVNAIVLEADGRVLIGGDFTHVNGVTRPFIARVYDRQPIYTIQISAFSESEVELTWEVGFLEQASNLMGPWSHVPGATSPYRVPLQGSQGSLRFFRLRLN